MIYEKTLLSKEFRIANDNLGLHQVTGCKCDICGEDCFSNQTAKDAKQTEYMTLKATWGYYSEHDTERWSAEVCEKCVVKYLEPIIKFRKTEYDLMSGVNSHPSNYILKEE